MNTRIEDEAELHMGVTLTYVTGCGSQPLACRENKNSNNVRERERERERERDGENLFSTNRVEAQEIQN